MVCVKAASNWLPPTAHLSFLKSDKKVKSPEYVSVTLQEEKQTNKTKYFLKLFTSCLAFL